MIVMGAGTNHWFHSDQTYRAILSLRPALRLPGRERRRLGALRRPGEGPADHRLVAGRVRARLVAAAAPAAGDAVLVPRAPTSGATSPLGAEEFTSPAGNGRFGKRHFADATRRPPGWAGCPPTRPSTATRSTSPTRPRTRAVEVADYVVAELKAGRWASPCEDPDAPGELPAGADRSGGPTCSAPRARGTSTSCVTCSASPTPRVRSMNRRPSSGRTTSRGMTRRRGQARPAHRRSTSG